ncbi:CBS domain-containing protein [Horticoccus luteus]|uniref:CBS domain-containing protein n=1 Tax=Horticoccus luteus TaxID=2862869 RepID=A0A8F9XKS2_9BACT|nr:CBS domain-containing protein [Horticoccus luteus]QYM78491.1 CBS domain-containing protein [Horticoccus luteus]
MNTPLSILLERKGAALYTVDSSATVAEAVEEMNRQHIGSVVVTHGEKMAGIFTERDVLRRIVGGGLDPQRTPVADVMTKDLITVSPATTVEEAMVIFADKRCRHLPVVEGGRCRGLISIGDISRWVSEVHQAEAEHLKGYIAGGMVT